MKSIGTTAIKSVLYGLLVGESAFLGIELGNKIGTAAWLKIDYWYQFAGGGLILALIFGYLAFRGFFSQSRRVLTSKRYDLLLPFAISLTLDLLFGGLGSDLYANVAETFTSNQIALVVSIPLVVFLSHILHRVVQSRDGQARPKTGGSSFLSDDELIDPVDDMLGYAQLAERFSQRVLAGAGQRSLVFGIDAPWGIGKTTFIHFCMHYWKDLFKDKVLLYVFSPLKHEDRTNLASHFLDGLIRTIQENDFVPELRPLLSRYRRLVKGIKGSISLFGFELASDSYSTDDALDDLSSTLANYDKQIIVVIDDLDRVDVSIALEMISTLKKSFGLSNVSYVLCYDTNNLAAMTNGDQSTEQLNDFLEKFVNIKLGLYIDSEALERYVSEKLDIVLSGNIEADPQLVSVAIGSLKQIIRSTQFHKYLPFIGNIRKIKRLINTVLLFGIETTDFSKSDFQSHDLIHLLLIYINYPSVFRKIYDTETNGKFGFFSVVTPHQIGYPKESANAHAMASNQESNYKNSTFYTEYLKTLSKNQRFLLDQVFGAENRLGDKVIASIPESIKTSYACFNGNSPWSGNNLEQYLNLIVKMSKPPIQGQHQYYVNQLEEIKSGKPVSQILAQPDYSTSSDETTHRLLWRLIVNSARDLDEQASRDVIAYLVNNIQNYCKYENSSLGLGFRDDAPFLLVSLLDKAGWTDGGGRHAHNTEDNIVEIAEWVFGEGRHENQGIISTLSEPSRGVLGLIDLLVFRLSCSADRGGDIFNLQRAIANHSNPNAPYEGSVNTIAKEEMREISQVVFQVFDSQYIQQKLNVFQLIDDLDITQIAGQYADYLQSKIDEGQISSNEIDTSIKALKTGMKSFAIFQLGNAKISSGVGCGFYDRSGDEDKNGIRVEMTKYIVDVCFNGEIDARNYEHFVGYLLGSMGFVFDRESGRVRKPHISQFTEVIDKTTLAQYWRANRASIVSQNFSDSRKILHTVNGPLLYREYITQIFELLDKLVEDPSEPAHEVSDVGN